MKQQRKRAEAEICLCISKDTKKRYYALMVNGNPLKYWAYDDMSDAARDFIGEIINAFDLGYDIRCQFPINDNGKKILVPRSVKMYNEPGSDKLNKNIKENFFVNNEKEDADGQAAE